MPNLLERQSQQYLDLSLPKTHTTARSSSLFSFPIQTHTGIIVTNGDSIASEGKGDYMFVEGRVMDTKGNPISGAIIDTWETDGSGQYDTQVSCCRSHDQS
jgi:protocatechuate 3,4-dioxygenase beta subunit